MEKVKSLPSGVKQNFTWPKMSRYLPFLVMIIVAFVSNALANIYYTNLIDQKRDVLQKDTDEIASFLTSRINSRQAMLTGMAAMVKSHSADGLEHQEFEDYASGLKANDPAIRVIQFFPLTGPVMLYPLEGNEAVVNRTFDILRTDTRPNVRADVQRAIESRTITVSNPYELNQGGLGIVARQAVYEGDTLLGMVVVILNQDELLNVPGLSPSLPEISYALRDKDGRTFMGEDRIFYLDPVVATVPLPEGVWTMGAVPAEGWDAGMPSRMILVWSIGVIFVLLAGQITYLSVTNQANLRRKVEERTAALSESEERYAQTFRVVNDGIWDWNIKKGAGFANDNFYTILGKTVRDFNGFDKWLPEFHPDDVEQAASDIFEGMRSGRGFNLQTRVKVHDAEWIHVLIRGRVVEQDEDGNAVRMLGTISDFTDQKRAEENLRESEAKFRAIFNNNHAIMMLIDPETTSIIDANPAACAYYGRSLAEMTSLKVSNINVLGIEDIKAGMQKAVTESRSFFIFQHRLADGEIRDVEVFSGPITQNGKTFLFSIVHDITARRQAERALEDNENRLRFALEGANDGLWDVLLQTGEFYISPRGYQILGYSLDEQPDEVKVWSQLVHPDDLPKTTKRLNDHLSGQAKIFEVEQRLLMKSGDWKWVLSRGKLVARDAQGQPVRITGTYTDITSRKQSEENMKAAQQELKRLLAEADASRQVLLSMLEDQKTTEEKLNLLNASLESRVRERTLQLETTNNELEAFSYSVSHDLRAPLRGIDGWSLALLEDYGDRLDEKGRLYMQRVRGESQRMGALIDDLLRLSRVTRMELKQSKINLSDQAYTIAGRLSEEFHENPPEFIIHPDIQACGDAQLLDVVLTNLLSNACKFSVRQPSPKIEFGEMRVNGHSVYFVRDNGIGFDSANAKKLFGAFQRMHKQTDFPGTGIGLATVKRVISRHGGQVWAESQKNLGATFYFTLPEVR